MESFVGEEKDFEVDALWYRESVEIMKDTHTHRCADLSEVRSRDDRSRGMSQGC